MVLSSVAKGVNQVVIFQLAGEFYGIDIRAVKEIILPLRVTPVPGSSHLIEGVISLRGQVIPILDLRKKFGFDRLATNKGGRIVVTEVDGLVMGLQVDGVSEVLRISAQDIEPPPPAVMGSRAGFIGGVAKLDDRLVVILDLTELYRTEDYQGALDAVAGG